MKLLNKCLPLYLGCSTNKGKFIGMREDTLLIENQKNKVEEYKLSHIGQELFFYLRNLDDLTEEQSKQLIIEGISIGRPYGYTFTGSGFLYLLSLNVDLFGLIKDGYAKDLKTNING